MVIPDGGDRSATPELELSQHEEVPPNEVPLLAYANESQSVDNDIQLSPSQHGEATPTPSASTSDAAATNDSNGLKRPMPPLWSQAGGSQTIESTTNDDEPSAKRAKEENDESSESQPSAASTEYSQEHGEATPAPSSSPSIDNPPTSNPDAPSTSTNQAADQPDVKPVVKKEEADSSALRESCQFGIGCYR